MKRKILGIFLTLCMLLTMLPTAAASGDASTRRSESDITYPVTGGYLYFDKNTGTITDCDESVTAAFIPSEIVGVPVTKIDAWAFYKCCDLAALSIPDSVTTIGEGAFYYCKSLTDVAISPNVTSIGDYAFNICMNLDAIWVNDYNPNYSSDDYGVLFNKDKTTLIQAPGAISGEYVIPDSVTTLEKSAFYMCYNLTSVTIPDSVTSIGEYAFTCDSNLTKVTIGNGVTSIGESAFDACTSLKNVTIGSGVTSIGKSAFYKCTSLRTLTIPDSVEIIDDDAFYACSNLTCVKIGSGVKSIGRYAFDWCESLTTVNIPNKVRTIGEGAFMSCTALTSVTIGKRVMTIGDYAFENCASLKSVSFLGDAPEIGVEVFQTWDDDSWEYVNIPGLTIYYIEGKEDWSSPTWYGYPTATWDGVVGFKDVPEGAWYADAVDYVVDSGLMNGMGKNEFRPEEAMTRAMLVTVLWRYAGSPAEGTNGFHDLTQDWYVQAVAWASENGIVTGYPDGTFRPDDKVTREQLATIIYRYCNHDGIDTSARADLTVFPDANKVNSYASDAISWAVSVGLITGITHGGNATKYLEPQTSATRAQVATILMRFIENVAN